MEENVWAYRKVFDKFNTVEIAKGIRASSPEPRYAEENRKTGLIFSGLYNSKFDEAICFSVDASGAILNSSDIEIESIYHLRKNQEETQLHQRTREFRTIKANDSFWKYISSLDEKNLKGSFAGLLK